MPHVIRRVLAPAVTFVLLATSVAAQSVDEIIAKNLEAKGGVAVLKGTTSVRTVAKATGRNGEATTITTMSKRPNYMRNEISAPGQSMVFGFDGASAWVAPPGMPAQPMPRGPQSEALQQSSQIDPPFLDYKAKGASVELVDTVSEGARRLHHLVFKPKTGAPMHFYIDAATGLESRMVVESEEKGQPTKMELRYSDYRTVDGRTMPFAVTQVINGVEMGQMKFEKIEFNVPLDDALFRMPK